ncbi:MAG: hypothetical protein MUO54_17080 [Anaerolineales bacterium]|nr:hypothetical protein [Anaerolineales bacterium]
MVDKFEKIADVSRENEGGSMEVLNKLIETARHEAVFSKPEKIGDTQIITASEVQVGMGFGYGLGSGPQIISNMGDNGAGVESEDTGMGSGGGGGGGASGRPVAIITISDEGVTVEPIIDATKIALAFFTMLGSIFFLGAQMKKGYK